ncbi:hypothetical protein [Robiginitalea sp. SC105]|uniref:hypothetical protein n=1 Tax=Robiginitalea sp. SC105 TaxID=2762332 RepID=UPI00163ADF71|nr:hypothetical protein [Robiginitalea sp. SC105]MBC2840569.1 hypothetical protein [Robiginitalea sp. SC105]
MDVLTQIVKESAIGPLTAWFKSLVISLFIAIVVTLASMLVLLLMHGSQTVITFGY